MKTVRVNLGRRSYSILIGNGLLKSLGSCMKEYNFEKKVLLISNPTVFNLYGGIVKESLSNSGFTVVAAEIGDGEEYKTLATAEKLYDVAFSNELDRRCPVVALGGGVVGDVAGFVAATYLRGVPFIQVPTTLLAQVDSSVGGKVAVNHPRGKNIIGAFYQPGLVLADTDTLTTLPARETKSGLAEVIKYGVIWSAEFFTWLEENMDKLLVGEREALAAAVHESCRIKARVVEEDETEQGLRAILNFGHTVGHAVEALTEYKVYTHGEAVGIGMAAAARLAETMVLLEAAHREKIENLVRRACLPADIPPGLSPEEMLESIYHDKKVTGGRLTFVLPESIGKVVIRKDIDEAAVKGVLRFCQEV